MSKVYFTKTVYVDVDNFSNCRTGELRFDVLLHDDDGPILRLIGVRWDGAKLKPAADRLPKPNPHTGNTQYQDHWKHGEKLERGMLKALEFAGVKDNFRHVPPSPNN